MISGIDYIMQLEQECDKQREYVKEEKEKVKELKNRIDKAIEYIKKYESIKAYYEYVDEDGYDEYNYDEDFKEELLEILGDKE